VPSGVPDIKESRLWRHLKSLGSDTRRDGAKTTSKAEASWRVNRPISICYTTGPGGLSPMIRENLIFLKTTLRTNRGKAGKLASPFAWRNPGRLGNRNRERAWSALAAKGAETRRTCNTGAPSLPSMLRSVSERPKH
jgi:hypothetical protein